MQGNFNTSGQREGVGILTRANGETYAGTWRGGVPHGQGETKRGGQVTARGLWEKGKMTKGICQPGGLGTYTGNLVNGEFHGSGALVFLDGSKYVGYFANDLADGYGRMTFDITRSKSITSAHGFFRRGKLQGPGTVVFRSGEEWSGTFGFRGSAVRGPDENMTVVRGLVRPLGGGIGSITFPNKDRLCGVFKFSPDRFAERATTGSIFGVGTCNGKYTTRGTGAVSQESHFSLRYERSTGAVCDLSHVLSVVELVELVDVEGGEQEEG